MDAKQAKQIKVGDRVCIFPTRPAEACTGEAIEVGYNAVKFRWDDGQVGIVHHNDMADISRCAHAEIVTPRKAS